MGESGIGWGIKRAVKYQINIKKHMGNCKWSVYKNREIVGEV